MRPADGKQRHRVVELRQPQLASSVMNAKIPVGGPLSEEQLDQLSGARKRYSFEHRPIQCGERRRESVATSRARVVAEKVQALLWNQLRAEPLICSGDIPDVGITAVDQEQARSFISDRIYLK